MTDPSSSPIPSPLLLPDAERLLDETLGMLGRSPRTVETYALMLRMFARHLSREQPGKPLDAVTAEDIAAYQRYLLKERKVGFSSFNQAECALRFFFGSPAVSVG